MRRLARTAPAGQLLHAVEGHALDAGKVNTVEDGWRDVKVAVFATEFGPRAEAEAWRLRGSLGPGLSVLGDGAEWMRDLAEDHFHGAAQVLDVWHGVQQLAEAGRAALGVGAEFRAWLKQARGQPLGDGDAGACAALAALGAATDTGQAADPVQRVPLSILAVRDDRTSDRGNWCPWEDGRCRR
jgi:hypothetical protein